MLLKLINIFTGTDLNLIHTKSSENSSKNSSENSSSNEFLVSPVAYSYMYIQWEANETISHELIRNIGLTFATIAIVSLVLIMNLQVSTYISLFSQDLSGHVPEIQAEVEVVKIKNPDFSCWA